MEKILKTRKTSYFFLTLLLIFSIAPCANATRTALEIAADVEALDAEVKVTNEAALRATEAMRQDAAAALAASQEASRQADAADQADDSSALQRANAIFRAANEMLARANAVLTAMGARLSAGLAAQEASTAAIVAATRALEEGTSGAIAAAETALATAQAALAAERTAAAAVTGPYNLYLTAKADYETAKSGAAGIVGGSLEDVSKLKKIPFETIPALINFYIKGLLPFVGIWALIFFVFGGIIWLTSGGNPDKIKKAQQMMVWATIGIVFIFASYAIVSRIIPAVGG
jgi:hypothetical protein